MKQWFRTLVALSLLFAYSLNISIAIQNFIVDTILNNDKPLFVSVNLVDTKTPELSIFPDLEPLGDLENENVYKVHNEYLKAPFQLFKLVDSYLLNVNNQYLYKSKNIQPGLDGKTLLYPFHSFS
ncbi:hypothetical protein ACFS5M_13750 [Lacinutrix iliipiscaria]|uniref:Uncharacterized protein n=1 Tax=Lacinutrix iliipiscaria TaxID=1230532 RepID=A0ABW5WQP3_9FLAO